LAGQVLLATPKGKWTRWSDYVSNHVWSCLGVEPAELSEIAGNSEVFQVLGLWPPWPSPEEKQTLSKRMNGL